MRDQKAKQREYDAKRRRDVFYIFTNSEARHVCKPGSTGWLNSRRSTVQGAFPFGTVEVAYFIETPYYRVLEKHVRDTFKRRKLNGDWVDATVDEVIAVVVSFMSTVPQVGAIHVHTANPVDQFVLL